MYVNKNRLLFVRDGLTWLANQCSILEKRCDKAKPSRFEMDHLGHEFSMFLEQRGFGKGVCTSIRWIPGVGHEVLVDVTAISEEMVKHSPRNYIEGSLVDS